MRLSLSLSAGYVGTIRTHSTAGTGDMRLDGTVGPMARDPTRSTVGSPMDGTAVTERLAHPELRERLDAADLEALRGRVDDSLHRQGVTFGPRRFEVDPVPRVIEADEWRELSAGIAQRVQALEAFVADAYGPRAIVAAGVMPERVLRGADHFAPELAGLRPPGGWIGVAGLDLLRGPDGRFAVVEDNLRTPSGAAYLLAARAGGRPRPGLGAARARRRARGPAGRAAGDPARGGAARRGAAVHRAGHRRAVQRRPLGAPRAGRRAADRAPAARRARAARRPALRAPPGRPCPPGGRRLPAHRRGPPVRRRRPADAAGGAARCRRGRPARWAWSTRTAPGSPTTRWPTPTSRTWSASTCGEEPILRSVDTYDLGDAARSRRRAGPHATSSWSSRAAATAGAAWSSDRGRRRPTRERASRAVRDDPERLRRPGDGRGSRATRPWSTGRLEPRHVDLRPFAYRAGDEVRVVPGGLTRVAFAEGELVVNSSHGGGAKDTWVLPSE